MFRRRAQDDPMEDGENSTATAPKRARADVASISVDR